jgi:hypothetical protein
MYFGLISFKLVSFGLVSFELFSFELISFTFNSFELKSFELTDDNWNDACHGRQLPALDKGADNDDVGDAERQAERHEAAE